jgi:hypothetical protein
MKGGDKMSADQRKSLEMAANGRNGHHSRPEVPSWYLAQPAVPGLVYVLTGNGYVVLPTRK